MESDDGPPGNHGQRPSRLRVSRSFPRQRSCSAARRSLPKSSPSRARAAVSCSASRTHGVASSATALSCGLVSSGLFSASAPASLQASNVARMRGSAFAMNAPSAFA